MMGSSPVFRGRAAVDNAAAQVDTAPFLVTGWATFRGGPMSCPVVLDGRTWANECMRVRLSDIAGAIDDELTAAITFRDVFDQLGGYFSGPLAAVVHARDPRAASCEPDPAVCSAMMVVDRIVWRGDEATAPHPIDAARVGTSLATLQGSGVTPMGAGVNASGCGSAGLPASLELAVDVGARRIPAVTSVTLGPTADAIHRAVPRPDGVDAALRPKAVDCEVYATAGSSDLHVTYRWLLFDNAAALVRTHPEPTAKDRAFMEEFVRLLGG